MAKKKKAEALTVSDKDQIRTTITKMEPEYSKALPPHISVQKFCRVLTTAVLKEPTHPSQDLMAANRMSLMAASILAAQDGLLPDGRESAFVVRGGKVVYMPMVAGILKKLRNSGELKTITAQVVHENDEFSYWVDENGPHFKHVPTRGERGDVVTTYASALTKDGGFYFEEIHESDMDNIKSMAQTQKIWDGPFGNEMRKKSAIRRLAKILPSSSDLDHFMENHDQDFNLDVSPEREPELPKKSRLEETIEAKVIDVEPAPEPEPDIVETARQIFDGDEVPI